MFWGLLQELEKELKGVKVMGRRRKEKEEYLLGNKWKERGE